MAQNGNKAREPVILGSARTPQGKFLGALASLTAALCLGGAVSVALAVELES